MFETILYAIALPAVLAGVVWGVAWRVWNRESAPLFGGTWAGAVAVAGAMIAGYIGVSGWSGYPPKVAEGWLPFIAIVAVFAGALEGVLPKFLRWGPWLTIVIWFAFILTERSRPTWTGTSIFLVLTTLAFDGCVQATEAVAQRHPGAALPLALWVWTAGLAGALGATGSITYGQLGGTLAAAMGAGVVAAWLKPGFSFSRGAVATVMILGGSLLLCGYFYSELPLSSALILAGAPAVLWLGETGLVTRRNPRAAVVIRAALIAVPVAIALLIALWPMIFPKAGAPNSSPDYY